MLRAPGAERRGVNSAHHQVRQGSAAVYVAASSNCCSTVPNSAPSLAAGSTGRQLLGGLRACRRSGWRLGTERQSGGERDSIMCPCSCLVKIAFEKVSCEKPTQLPEALLFLLSEGAAEAALKLVQKD